MKNLIFLLLIPLSASFEVIDNDLIVELNDGNILGRYITSRSGKLVKSFMGIPYAAPPVGNLRFRSPQKPQKWNDLKRTQKDGSFCIQEDIGDEDCLYLNVYVPSEVDALKKLPVMLWIHGGGLSSGEGGFALYNPEFIVDHDIILVSGNYRLGPLGFLSTEDENAPGNFGLKDQVMILQWIQENIEHFGGDKNSVTIWGESAGGDAVSYHMISPLSKKLFHRAISNSGTIHSARADPWRKGEVLEKTKQLAEELNCPTKDTSALVSCLRDKSPYEIVKTANRITTERPYRMTIEDFPVNEPAFISTRQLPKESSQIPWLIGINSDEGYYVTERLVDNFELRENLVNQWKTSLPRDLDYHHLDEAKKASLTQEITQFYFGTDELKSGFDIQNLTNLYTDERFLGIVESLKRRFDYGNYENTFVYLFSHKGSASLSLTENFVGTTHADDMIYFFPWHLNRRYSSIPTHEDEELFNYMPMLWVNFVKNGHPHPTATTTIPKWPIATSVPFEFMQIGNENGKSSNLFKINKGLYEDRANFWMKVREDYKLSRWNGGNLLKIPTILIMFCTFIANLSV